MFLKKQWCRIGEEVKPQKFGIRQVDEGQISTLKRLRSWARLHKTPVTVTGIRTCTRNLSELH